MITKVSKFIFNGKYSDHLLIGECGRYVKRTELASYSQRA